MSTCCGLGAIDFFLPVEASDAFVSKWKSCQEPSLIGKYLSIFVVSKVFFLCKRFYIFEFKLYELINKLNFLLLIVLVEMYEIGTYIIDQILGQNQ